MVWIIFGINLVVIVAIVILRHGNKKLKKELQRWTEYVDRKSGNDATVILQFQMGNTAINYAVRNCTVMDNEQTRLGDDFENMSALNWRQQWKPQLIDSAIENIQLLIDAGDWEDILENLLPHISNRELYDSDFEKWEDLLFKACGGKNRTL